MIVSVRWILARPLVLQPLAAAILVAAGVLLAHAARQSDGTWLGAGMAVAMFGLWLLDQSVRVLTQKHPAVVSSLGMLALVGAVWILAAANDRRSSPDAAAGVVVTLAALVLLGRSLVEWGNRKPLVWTLSGVALLLVGGPAVGLGAPVAGGGLLLAGAVGLRSGIGPLCQRSARASEMCTVLGVAAAVVGGATVLAAAYGGNLELGVFGAFLLVVGLMPLTAGWLALAGRRLGFVAAIGGVVILGALGYAFFPRESALWIPSTVALLVVALGISFSWRGEGFLVAAIVGFVFVWVLVDRGDRGAPDPHPGAPERILVMGDSYISGEGSTTFFANTNLKAQGRNDPENQCRRSSTAYPYVLADAKGMGLDSFACSGAVANEIDLVGQMPRSPEGVEGSLPQLANEPVDRSSIRLVLVSIGGNDAEFGDIGIACVLPGSCSQLRDAWLVNVSRIGNGITTAFKAIRAEYGSIAPIVAVPYPDLIATGGCDWSVFTRSEHAFLNEFVTVLNDRVRKSAEQAGIHFFGKALFAFKNHRICEGGPDDTYMNFFNFHPTEGGLLARMTPAHWLHGTFHPKPAGHAEVARILGERLAALLERADARIANGRAPNPDPNPDAVFDVPRVQLLGTELFDPADLPAGDEMCPFAKVSPFASVLPLIDATTPFKIDALREFPICHTRPDGTWTDDRSILDLNDGELVRVHPELPQEGSTELIVYRASDRSWHLRIVRFCERDLACPHDVSVFMKEQLGLAAKRMALPILLILIGSWLVALGIRGVTFTNQRIESREARRAAG